MTREQVLDYLTRNKDAPMGRIAGNIAHLLKVEKKDALRLMIAFISKKQAVIDRVCEELGIAT